MNTRLYHKKQIWTEKRKKPDRKDYKIWKIAMNRLVPNRFLQYTLGKWLHKLHNIEMWSYDIRNKVVTAQIDKIYRIFEKS